MPFARANSTSPDRFTVMPSETQRRGRSNMPSPCPLLPVLVDVAPAAPSTAPSVEIRANCIRADRGRNCNGSSSRRRQRTRHVAKATFTTPTDEAGRTPRTNPGSEFPPSPEWRLTPFALVNPYAGTFGPETIAPEKCPLPFGPSSRSGFALQISLLLRCAASLRPLGRGSGPPAPSWPGFIATGS